MDVGLFLAGIGALLWDPATDRYLLLKRSENKDFAPGAWECVTGRVDQGEGFEDAVHREVGEELGIGVRVQAILGTTHFYRGGGRPENELVGVVYLVTSADPADIRLSAEHSEHKWITFGEADMLLSDDDLSQKWLLNVLRRAEQTKDNVPLVQPSPDQKYVFELDS